MWRRPLAGGGVAALEAALALADLAGDRAEVTICSPRPNFVYRPYAVGVPYGVSRVATYELARLGADVEPAEFDPILRGVLWTGAEPRYLQGWLAGGHGETSTMTEAPPWGADQGKIVGRYLTGFLAGVAA